MKISGLSLINKLIIAFLIVSLIPLMILAYLTQQRLERTLINNANQSLTVAASQTASEIDAFIISNLDNIDNLAHLPQIVNYLNVPANERLGSREINEILRALRNRNADTQTLAYGVLDQDGTVIATNGSGALVGFNEAEQPYFQMPAEQGTPSVTNVLFAEDAPYLYFSSPVTNPIGQFLGVVYLRYSAEELQTLIGQNNGLLGKASFPILFDESVRYLAHGADPSLVFQKPNQLALTRKLETASQNRFFASTEVVPDEQPHQVAVFPVRLQPWYVAYAQPQAIFLQPIEAQVWTTFGVAVAIAAFATLAAFLMGQWLTRPIIHLTNTVTQFTAGNLSARVPVVAEDEIGVLARSFNAMAQQVSSLLTRLEERTYELEAEIFERQRSVSALISSEERYRTLFEESKDAIFIGTPDGKLSDINSAGLALFGYDRPTLMALSLEELFEDPKQAAIIKQKLDQDNALKDFPVRYQRQDGTVIDCLLTATLRRDEQGEIVQYQGIIRDVSRYKQAERERMRLLAIEKELNIAQDIQQSLLARPNPNWPHLELICFTTPAREMGGDLYTYHHFPATEKTPTKYSVTVGDVSGKGLPAALLMAISLASLDSIVSPHLSPNEILSRLDQTLMSYTQANRQNCALIYMELSLLEGAEKEANNGAPFFLRIANAGCVLPLIKRCNGAVEWVETGGMPLGVGLGAEVGYEEITLSLMHGDLIILTSDGVIEAQSSAHELFGFGRLEAAVDSGPTETAEAMLHHLRAAVTNFMQGDDLHDDLTIVVARL